jgi:hypothetical protein
MDLTLGKRDLGRKADSSDLLDHAVRVGLVSYGIVHLLVAWLALELAFGHSEGKASSSGALHQLAESGLGRISLYVVGAGFIALAIWQGLDATVGHRDKDGVKRVGKRAVSGAKVVIYGALAVTALKTATSSGSSGGSSTDSWTAKLMDAPGGPVLVGLLGLIVIAVAGALVWRGLTEKFREKLDVDGNTGKDGRAYVLFGKVGYVAKGAALAIIGGMFVYAALTHDPHKSTGLDGALKQLLDQPFGQPLLVAMAAGFACFGLFCFAWARHLDR